MGSILTHRLWADRTDVEPISNAKQKGTTAAEKVINALVPELENDINHNVSPDPTDYKPLIERPETCKNEATNNEPTSSTAIRGTIQSQSPKQGSDNGQYYRLQNLDSLVEKRDNTRLPAETAVENCSSSALKSSTSDKSASIQSPNQKSNPNFDQQTRNGASESLNKGTQPATTDTGNDISGNNGPIHTKTHSPKPLKQSSRYIFRDNRSTKMDILIDP